MKKVQHKSNLPHPDGQRQWWCVAGTSQPKAPAQESVSQETLCFTMGCLSHFECFSGRLCFTWGSVSSDESFTCRKRKARPEQSSALHSISALNSGFPFWDFLPPWWVKNPRYWLCLVSNLPVLVSSLPWSWKQACYCSPQDLPQPSQSSRKPPYSLKKTQVFLLLCFHWAVGITAAKLLRFGLPLPAMSFAGNQGKTTAPQIMEGNCIGMTFFTALIYIFLYRVFRENQVHK